MNKLAVGLVVAAILIIIGGALLFSKKGSSNTEIPPLANPTAYEYYWGDGCPHCKNVDDFFNSWENYDKVNIEKYEVWYNKANQARAKSRAQSCGIDPTDIGVPFLVKPDSTCLRGDVEIIEHFKSLKVETSLNNPEVSYALMGV